ncbi:Dihydrolipoyllysine-residue acetyltransferase component of pyruvate dehydrogenase complex [Oceanobacillus picturae]|uniref:Dihydrolipoamide acetyltransferase component of pyruvate dehydrogenase complex n=1 Tax=Oceanobacillus picturae TaxID=171693 RepID=W9AKU4_9BACI|nr:dihydrolipoamide acetyltransferase family protein [Oceanobacillus picturae]CDO03527.1 Dihydrolipoyllysine-residue acetyltransferase component of pyruvate dehydrogenase complex [Oceanobacillus picturae]
MAKEIFMPKLSSTMEVGTLLQWFKKEGEEVEVGEPLFEIMTDKINIEVESYEEGILLKKYNEVDDEVPVNAIVGYIGEANESVPDSPPIPGSDDNETAEQAEQETVYVSEQNEKVEREAGGKVRATPAARRVSREQGVSLENVNGSGPKGRIHAADVEASSEKVTPRRHTPLAGKVAENEGVSLGSVQGTGANGKITKSDVLSASSGQIETSNQEPLERVKLKGLRKAVADKMLESARSIPHVTLTAEVDMSATVEVRKSLLPIIEKQTGYRLSYTEIIMKATAHVLGNHKKLNAALIDNEIVFNKSVNLGLAVAVESGLIVPSVPNVQDKGLAELTVASKELGAKARENKLKPAEMTGSTFTISNLGMYAIEGFTPIINPPETAILGVGRMADKPVVVDKSIEIRPIMVLSLSFDHRVIDGAPAAAFLTELKERLENPFGLLV